MAAILAAPSILAGVELRTERLVLRPVAADDLDLLLELRNEPRVLQGTSTGEPLPWERMARQLAGWLALWRDRGVGAWIVLLDGAPAAFVDLSPIGEGYGVDPDELELGVIVHPRHWGQGIAGEAGLAVAADCFSRAGLERLYATADPGNAASLRALAKAPGVRLVAGELYELTAG